jgi:hypothetical protein
MNSLAGTAVITRLALRRDRIMLPAWVYLITAGLAGTAYSFRKLYPTAAARATFAVSGGGNPALRFLYGRLYGSSTGALTAWRYGTWAAIFGALMTIFIVIRHTRADEEAGRQELIGSAVVGRQAALTAGLLGGSDPAVPGAAADRAAGRGQRGARAGHRRQRAGVHWNRGSRRPACVRGARRARAGLRRAGRGLCAAGDR